MLDSVVLLPFFGCYSAVVFLLFFLRGKDLSYIEGESSISEKYCSDVGDFERDDGNIYI